MSDSAGIKLVRGIRETGSTTPAWIGGHCKPPLTETKARLAWCGIEADCLTTVWSTLRWLGLSHKNSLKAAEQDREDVAEHRRPWRVR